MQCPKVFNRSLWKSICSVMLLNVPPSCIDMDLVAIECAGVHAAKACGS